MFDLLVPGSIDNVHKNNTQDLYFKSRNTKKTHRKYKFDDIVGIVRKDRAAQSMTYMASIIEIMATYS